MAETGATGAWSPWSDRVFRLAPVAPFWLGIALGLLLAGSFFAFVYLTGDLASFMASDERWWQSREGRMVVLLAGLAAYFVTARHYSRAGAEASLERLRAAIPWTPRDLEAAHRPRDVPSRRATRMAGIAGLSIVPVTAFLIDRDVTLYLQGEYWAGGGGFTWIVGAVVAWNAGTLFHALRAEAARFSALGRRVPEIDFFDLSALTPFARQGLRSALPGLVVLAFFALNALDRGFFWVLPVMGGLSLAALVLGLVGPMRGVHERIRELKRAEIARVDAAIRGDAAALAATALGRRADPPGVGDLLAYRQFVAAVREWPFDASARIRVLLYLAIPIGSWLGGAFVERLLDAALS